MQIQLDRAGTPGPKAIGIDEISIKKGHTYRIVVSDLIRKRPIWFGGADRSEASMLEFYDWLGPKKAQGIRLAVMDMWKPFRTATQQRAPQAAILFDKFRVMRHLGKALDKVRKSEYGSPRMVRELPDRGFPASKERVERLMRRNGIRARHKRRFKATTDSKHALPVAPNLLARDFTPATPNQVWSADMTYIWTDEGWLYLAVVLDLFNREVVGWSIKPRMTADIVIDALTMAWFRKKPAPGLIHHSDPGSQYASHAFQARLEEYGMVCSMSRKGDCWDNAPTESFFNNLKNERVHGTRYSTRHGQQLAAQCRWRGRRKTEGREAQFHQFLQGPILNFPPVL
ncbi:MAG: IS3 family transposase [Sulfuritalea sp.]|nr:IS3 family transposase [Sulfuritalea sp.]